MSCPVLRFARLYGWRWRQEPHHSSRAVITLEFLTLKKSFYSCAYGFFRQRNTTTCFPCNCSGLGAWNQSCSSEDGTCFCRSNFGGDKCHTCKKGFFNASNGCLSCDCERLGSTEDVCDGNVGSCLCRASFTGGRCDQCHAGSYLLGHLCGPCECNHAGTAPTVCGQNGTCLCKKFVMGDRCDKCVDGFVDLASNDPHGCRCTF